MKMTAKFEAEGESFNACFEQLNSAFNAEFSASGGGQDGKDGATFTPSVSEDGVISWTNDQELPNPAPVNIKGEKGDKGDTGANGKNGTNGVDGKDGKDGFSPVVAVDDIENGHRVTITDKDGAKSFDVMDGKDGQGGGGVASWNDLTDKPDFAPIATSGSWNDLTDKPFGEVPAFDIQWNGDMTDKFALEMSMLGYNKGTYFVKVDDAVFTPEDIVWGTISISNGNRFTVMGSDIDTQSFPGAYKIQDYVGIVHNQSLLNNALGLPDGYITNGTYFFINTNLFTNRFTSPRKIVPLDEKYIPDIIARKTDIPEIDLSAYAKTEDLEAYAKTEELSAVAISGSWNDLEDKPFGVGKTSWVLIASGQAAGTDRSISLSAKVVEGKNYKLEVVESLTNMLLTSNVAPATTVSLNWYLIGNNQDAVYGECFGARLTVKWIVVSPYGYDYRVNVYEEQEIVATLDEKYLPDSVVLESELEGKGYQTEEQVTTLINNALGVIEDGSY